MSESWLIVTRNDDGVGYKETYVVKTQNTDMITEEFEDFLCDIIDEDKPEGVYKISVDIKYELLYEFETNQK
jgi:hypothetical protein